MMQSLRDESLERVSRCLEADDPLAAALALLPPSPSASDTGDAEGTFAPEEALDAIEVAVVTVGKIPRVQGNRIKNKKDKNARAAIVTRVHEVIVDIIVRVSSNLDTGYYVAEAPADVAAAEAATAKLAEYRGSEEAAALRDTLNRAMRWAAWLGRANVFCPIAELRKLCDHEAFLFAVARTYTRLRGTRLLTSSEVEAGTGDDRVRSEVQPAQAAADVIKALLLADDGTKAERPASVLRVFHARGVDAELIETIADDSVPVDMRAEGCSMLSSLTSVLASQARDRGVAAEVRALVLHGAGAAVAQCAAAVLAASQDVPNLVDMVGTQVMDALQAVSACAVLVEQGVEPPAENEPMESAIERSGEALLVWDPIVLGRAPDAAPTDPDPPMAEGCSAGLAQLCGLCLCSEDDILRTRSAAAVLGLLFSALRRVAPELLLAGKERPSVVAAMDKWGHDQGAVARALAYDLLLRVLLQPMSALPAVPAEEGEEEEEGLGAKFDGQPVLAALLAVVVEAADPAKKQDKETEMDWAPALQLGTWLIQCLHAVRGPDGQQLGVSDEARRTVSELMIKSKAVQTYKHVKQPQLPKVSPRVPGVDAVPETGATGAAQKAAAANRAAVPASSVEDLE